MKEFDPGESASIVSVTDRVRPLPLGMGVSSVHFLGERAFFVGTEENVAHRRYHRRNLAYRRPWRRHPVRGLRR